MIPWFQITTFDIGPVRVPVFGVLIALGIVVGAIMAGRRARVVGLDREVLMMLMRLTVFFGILGGYAVVRLESRRVGISSLGAIFSGVAVCCIYMRRKGIPILLIRTF